MPPRLARTDDQIETVLAKAVASAHAAWPNLAVNDSSFVAHIGRCIPPQADPEVVMATLNVDDLWLARACLDGAPGATDAFQKRYRPTIGKYLARIEGASDLADEIAQEVFTRLLVATDGRPAMLNEYQGRSKLGHFVGVAAQRLALNHRRADQTRRRLADRLADEPLTPASGAEQQFLRLRYRKQFEDALRRALSDLTERERVVMKMHLVRGVSTVRIATMYRVNHTTVSRWLSHSRLRIWTAVKAGLRRELGLPSEELESLLRSVVSHVDLNLSAELATPSPA